MLLYQLFLVSLWYIGFATVRVDRSASTTSPRRETGVADGVKSSINGHFSKEGFKKRFLPVLEDELRNNCTCESRERRVLHATTTVLVKKKEKITFRSSLSSYSKREQSLCSPVSYQLTLSNGNCSRIVETKMCYGFCSSFTVPRKSSFGDIGQSLRRVVTSCTCCSPVRVSTEIHALSCILDVGPGHMQTFRVPLVKRCACRPCGN